MNPKLCPQFSRVAIVSSITPGTGRRYNGSGFFFLSDILLVGLLCGGSKHCLTRPPTNTILLSALFLFGSGCIELFAQPIRFCLSPKFVNKGCDWYQRGMATFAYKADVVICDGCQSSHVPIMFW